MPEPAAETLPVGAALLVFFLAQVVTLTGVLDELLVEFMSHLFVNDDGVDFVVEAQAAGVEVRAANGAEAAISADLPELRPHRASERQRPGAGALRL